MRQGKVYGDTRHARACGEVVRANCFGREDQTDRVDLDWLRQITTADDQISGRELAVHAGLIGRPPSLDVCIHSPVDVHTRVENHSKG